MLPPLPGSTRPLAPMRLGEVFETIASLYRANARTVIGLTALVAVPAFLVSVLLGRAMAPLAERLAGIDPLTADPAVAMAMVADAFALIGLSFAVVALDQVTISLVAAALALAVGRPGQPPLTAPATLRALAPVVLRILPVVAIVLFAIAGLAVVLVALFLPLTLTFGANLAGGGAGAFVMLLVAMAVAAVLVFVLVRWSLAAPVVALERAGPLAALGTSWRLVAGFTWRVLGYAVLMGIVVVVLDLTLVQSVAAMASAIAPALVTPIEVGLGAIAQTLLVPLGALLSLVLYFDLRLRAGGRVPRAGPS